MLLKRSEKGRRVVIDIQLNGKGVVCRLDNIGMQYGQGRYAVWTTLVCSLDNIGMQFG